MTTQQRVHPAIGDPAEFLRAMELFRTSFAFANSQHAELLKSYPDEWTGIYDGEVRAHDRDIHRMLAQVDALGVPRQAVFTQFVDTNPLPRIL